jgi:hypothetical protein
LEGPESIPEANEAKAATLRALIRWCEDDRAMLALELELMETGKISTRASQQGADTTHQSIEKLRTKIAELDQRLAEWHAVINRSKDWNA